VDSLVHDTDTLGYLIKKIGINKIALGTDYPFPLGDLEPGKLIESSNYTDEMKKKMLSRNAWDWLGLNHKNFS